MSARFEASELMLLTIVRATRSPDPSTQNGSILADREGGLYTPVLETLSCNEFPFDVKYTDDRWERPAKYAYIEHAERNSIYRAALLGIPTEGLTMFCPWAACADCARAIIQCGLDELVTVDPTGNTSERWQESIAVAMGMLAEAGVHVTMLPTPIPGCPEIRRDGELIRL